MNSVRLRYLDEGLLCAFYVYVCVYSEMIVGTEGGSSREVDIVIF